MVHSRISYMVSGAILQKILEKSELKKKIFELFLLNIHRDKHNTNLSKLLFFLNSGSMITHKHELFHRGHNYT